MASTTSSQPWGRGGERDGQVRVRGLEEEGGRMERGRDKEREER